jgi:hypothetical protein
MTKQLSRGQYDGSKADAPMAQVREILFGAQLKDMEMRFRRQEERFLREITEVKESLRGRLDSLENFMKSEVASILSKIKEEHEEREATLKTEQRERQEEIKAQARERIEQLESARREFQEAIAKEQRERGDQDSRLGSDLAASNENFERRSAKLTATLENTERALRELLMKESAALNDKIEEKYDDTLNVIEKTSSQIRSDMVYRTALSTMMTEVVASLSKPWNLDVAPEDEPELLEASEDDDSGHEGGYEDQNQGQADNQGQGDDHGHEHQY